MKAFKTTLITSVGAFLIGAASAALVCIQPVFAQTDGAFAAPKISTDRLGSTTGPIWANPRTLPLPHSLALLWLPRQRTWWIPNGRRCPEGSCQRRPEVPSSLGWIQQFPRPAQC
jgi:hypothetical protein